MCFLCIALCIPLRVMRIEKPHHLVCVSFVAVKCVRDGPDAKTLSDLKQMLTIK